MPQNAPFTIKDGASTPADHVFQPLKITADNKALFVENVTGTLLGRPQFSYAVTGGQNGAAFKAVLQLNVPKVVTVTDGSGASKVSVVHTCIGKAEFVLPPSTSAQERKDIRVMMANAILHATIGEAIDNVESFW
jgi:hypothetical protein